MSLSSSPSLAYRTLLAGCVALLFASGCTKTVYVVQNPDGTLVEIDPPDDRDDVETIVIDDVLSVEVLTSHDHVLIDGNDDTVYLQVELEARRDVEEVRPAMNLALVVDRSGSMQGLKMRHAKAAASSLVDDLEDGDRVTLLSYASDVSLEVGTVTLAPDTRDLLHHAISQLAPAGGTHISGGLNSGAQEVVRHLESRDLGRVILVSDGRPTVGESKPWALETLAARWYEEGVSITTMGIGVDYNEDLMSALAVAGGGNYYYVAAPTEMEAIFSQELSSMGSTVARDVELHLDLPRGVRVREVYGYKHKAHAGGVTVEMASMARGQKRRLLVALDVPERARTAARSVRVAGGRLAYRQTTDGQKRSVALPERNVRYTSSRSVVAKSVNRPVVAKLEAVRNARVRHEAMAKLDAGDRAAAKSIVNKRLSETRRISGALGGAALADEAVDFEDFADEVESAPAPSSNRYKHMKKRQKAKAYRSTMY